MGLMSDDAHQCTLPENPKVGDSYDCPICTAWWTYKEDDDCIEHWWLVTYHVYPGQDLSTL
jgi:hypothetical protein